MRPVDQTETEPGRGNCLAACIASLLELPIEAVPNFRLADDPWVELQHWLAIRGMFALKFPAEFDCVWPIPVGADCILTGKSPRDDRRHAVVGRVEGQSWRLVHDPRAGDRRFLDGDPEWVTFLGKLNPAG